VPGRCRISTGPALTAGEGRLAAIGVGRGFPTLLLLWRPRQSRHPLRREPGGFDPEDDIVPLILDAVSLMDLSAFEAMPADERS